MYYRVAHRHCHFGRSIGAAQPTADRQYNNLLCSFVNCLLVDIDKSLWRRLRGCRQYRIAREACVERICRNVNAVFQIIAAPNNRKRNHIDIVLFKQFLRNITRTVSNDCDVVFSHFTFLPPSYIKKHPPGW